MLYGVENTPGCRENFLKAIEPHGLAWRDLVPNINFFCSVPVGDGGDLAPGVFATSRSKAGDHVGLRAEMRVLVAISNCPQVNNPVMTVRQRRSGLLFMRWEPDRIYISSEGGLDRTPSLRQTASVRKARPRWHPNTLTL